tara:strand:+ start:317 stop:544 length:228 start_codon:yes stop_codon:yes gene_type:complete
MYSFSPSSIPYGLAIFLFGRWAVVAQPFLFPLMLKWALLKYTLKAVFYIMKQKWEPNIQHYSITASQIISGFVFK